MLLPCENFVLAFKYLDAEFLSLVMSGVSRNVFPNSRAGEVNFLTAGTDCLHLANTL